MAGAKLPTMGPKTRYSSVEKEILYNLGLFIMLMLFGKFCSFLWKFRLYRKSVKRHAVPKRARGIKAARSKVATNQQLIDTTRMPQHAHRVKSLKDFLATLSIGQHYAVRRIYLGYPLYHHILISDHTSKHVHVIHYNGEAGVFLKSGSKIFGHVIEESVEIDDSHYFDIPNNLFVIRDPRYPSDKNTINGILVRARERIGENRYGITYNNCEHFVRWALTGKPDCQQYYMSNMNEKVMGAMVDELPNIGARMSMKLCKELLYAITMGVESLVLQNSARLVQHTASASVSSILSTGAATLGWMSPVEAAFLTFRILDWKYHMSRGTMNTHDYNNAKDKAITGSVFSLVFATLGAMFGQVIIPLPAMGAVIGSFWGGFSGRIFGILLAGYGIALKEKFLFDVKYRRVRLSVYRNLNKTIDRCKGGLLTIPDRLTVSFTKKKMC
ncbi:uncharacterized protein [Watersipora subatra]|uniref:uncharacterized protein n=1 Tax=Watersipora subatra TaxID=2589382 RepID=UPI00355B7AF2